MTEDEAKGKWCPMVGRLTKNGADHETCIGSACMMWRWHKYDEFVLDKMSCDMSDRNKVINTKIKVKNTAPHTGHCGLAGKP